MTTGYTSILLEKPDTTFREFTLRCARAMNVCVGMRDESLDVPPPTEVKVDSYLIEGIKEAEGEVQKYEAMTLREATALCKKEHEATLRRYAQLRAKLKRENAVFQTMIDNVQSWKPPTPKHDRLKKFMLEQLNMSLSPSNLYDEVPPKLDPSIWLENKRHYAMDRLKSCRASYDSALTRAKESTEWLRDLRESLRGLK